MINQIKRIARAAFMDMLLKDQERKYKSSYTEAESLLAEAGQGTQKIKQKKKYLEKLKKQNKVLQRSIQEMDRQLDKKFLEALAEAEAEAAKEKEDVTYEEYMAAFQAAIKASEVD